MNVVARESLPGQVIPAHSNQTPLIYTPIADVDLLVAGQMANVSGPSLTVIASWNDENGNPQSFTSPSSPFGTFVFNLHLPSGNALTFTVGSAGSATTYDIYLQVLSLSDL